jgi:2-oxoglutarate dehydrogenase E2 component (dihydrolipoamide succinyltransferase)
MAKFEIIMPKLGESIIEATITRWLKQEGDILEEDDSIVEIATDKVDSEVPSPVDGVVEKLLFKEGDVVEVGKVIAIIKIDGDEEESSPANENLSTEKKENYTPIIESPKTQAPSSETIEDKSDRFFSPLVRNIAKKENISLKELEPIQGTGSNGRLTKEDLLAFIEKRKSGKVEPIEQQNTISAPIQTSVVQSGNNEIVEMGRVRKLIADHMVRSKQTSPHVTSFIEVDMSKVVAWREANKASFEKKYGTKITYTHIIIDAAINALKDFPYINASLDGDKIILKKSINFGMATALDDGNLIVPVLHNADMLNLSGIAKTANDLAQRARKNALKPEEISGGTFTFTNLGSFGSLTGTPIINQPQLAILAAGIIKKKVAVIESPQGDSIGIRPEMILSLSYDHRVVDGAMGGLYIKKLAEYLENFNEPNL